MKQSNNALQRVDPDLLIVFRFHLIFRLRLVCNIITFLFLNDYGIGKSRFVGRYARFRTTINILIKKFQLISILLRLSVFLSALRYQAKFVHTNKWKD